MAGLSFAFDTSKGETPQSIAQKRALVAQIMGSQGAPTTLGGGFSALGDGIVANVTGRRADAAQEAGQSQVDAFRQMLTGNYGAPGQASTSGVPSVPSSGPQSAPASAPASFSGDQQAFVNALLPGALEASRRTGIDPRIIIAQSAEESGWGKHTPGNNFFGIKSHGQPGGQQLSTMEEVNGQMVPTTDSFRTYASPSDSVSGYADFILQNPRYKPLMAAQGIDAQLAALGQSGYASNSRYTDNVGRIARGLQLPDMAQTPQQATTAMAAGQVASLDQSIGMPQQQVQMPPIAPAGGPQAAQVQQQAPMPPQQAPSPQMAQSADTGLSMQQLMQAAGNPFVMAQYGDVINSMISQQMQQQDPAYQQSLRAGDLGIQKSELEIDAMRHPPAPAPAPVKYEVIGGQVVAIDPNSNSASSIGSFGQPATAPRPMTPEDRAMWGIPASDTTPYYLDENGQPKAIGGGGQTINVGQGEIGSIPPDYELITDPVTGARSMQIIPGSPSDRKAQADAASAQSTADANQNQASRYGNVVVEDIDRALGVLAKDPTWSTGLLGQAMGNFKGSNSDRLNNLLDTVRANSAFDRLQAMRNASPTGGALGAVSERELGLLQSAIGSLETGNADDLAYNLKRLQTIYSDIIDGPKASTTPAQAQPGDIDSLLQKYGVP